MTRRPAHPSDEELVERLRTTFRREADALAPYSERVRAIAAIEVRQAHVATVRRRMAAGTVAAVLTAAAVIGALLLLPGTHPRPVPVNVAGGPPAASVTRAAHSPAGPVRPTPPGSSAPPVSTAMPPSFVPLSVTFVPIRVGWVLGTVTCASGRCLALAHTTDAGATWTDLGRPSAPGGASLSIPASAGTAARLDLHLRFAAGGHGWIYGNVGGSPLLWATDDGGRSWHVQALPSLGTGVAIDALETNDGLVQVVASSADPAEVHLLTWGILARSWKVSPTTLPSTSASTSVQLVLQQASAWVIEDRGGTRIGAATYDMTTGTWSPWASAPCAGAAVQVATASLAVCQPSGSTPYVQAPGPQAGSTVLPAGLATQAVATPDSATIAVGGVVGAVATIDLGTAHGTRWGRAWSSSRYDAVRQLGFESTSQGVALVTSPGGASMLMTTTGGTAWRPVDFSA